MTAFAAAGCASDIAGPEVPLQAVAVATETVLVNSDWSGYTTADRRVITTDAEWAAAWAQIHDGQTPVPARPAIDFSREVVILAAMGVRPTTGFSITIDEVSAHAGIFYVRVTEASPANNCVVGQAQTAPVHVVRAAREAATAQFIVNRVERRC